MAVTAALIKQLRETTGVGMLECKNVLAETDGNIEKSIELLRERGLAAAQKKAGRIAAEGLVCAIITEDGKKGALVEVNSETDFVAKNQDFVTFVKQVAEAALKTEATEIEGFLESKWLFDDKISIKDALNQKIVVIGENLNIRRFEKFEACEKTTLVSYIHGQGKIAVIAKVKSEILNDEVKEAGRNMCMQIAAMNPKFVSKDDVPADVVEKEREILKQQALNEGKPLNIVEKMIEGRLNKNLKEFCLNEQEYFKSDDNETCGKYLKAVSKTVGADVVIKNFVRYATGEGIEKKTENFADEVNKVMQG